MNGSTVQSSDELKFVDETFGIKNVQVKVAKVNIPPEPTKKGQPVKPDVLKALDYTEEDVAQMVEIVCSTPTMYLDKLPVRTPEQIKPFSHQLYLYCVKKKINPYDYLFDEMGIVITGIGLFGGFYKDYKQEYGKEKDKRTDKQRKLDADFDHQKTVDEMNRIAKEDGVIK